MQHLHALRDGLSLLREGALSLQRHEEDLCERRFRHIANHTPMMLWTAGADGLLNFISRTWLRLRGCSLAAELGEGWLNAVHPDDNARVQQDYRNAFHFRREFTTEYRVRVAGGSYRRVINSGCPIFSSEGVFAGYAGYLELSGDERGFVQPGRRIASIPLTEREREVLTRIAEGCSTKEVGIALGISYKTADCHRTNIMEKLDIHDTATLVRYAIRAGLIEP